MKISCLNTKNGGGLKKKKKSQKTEISIQQILPVFSLESYFIGIFPGKKDSNEYMCTNFKVHHFRDYLKIRKTALSKVVLLVKGFPVGPKSRFKVSASFFNFYCHIIVINILVELLNVVESLIIQNSIIFLEKNSTL